MNVKFVDLNIQYENLREQMESAFREVIEESAFIRGRHVKAFEDAYRTAYGVGNCISVANGTDAIYIALKMLGVGRGDEVITTAMSWISTSEVITQAGAKPVFVDIDPVYRTIDPGKIEEKITERTRAIIPVHLYGQPADMDPIMRIANEHGLHVIEDCAQAHFAEYRGRRVGTFGTCGTFSFYPAKNLGAYGDAGAIITDDDRLAGRMRMYANHGSSADKHDHEFEGINSRLDGLQAAVLGVKLPHVGEWNAARVRHAQRYRERLAGLDWLRLPEVREDSTHVFHLFVVQTEEREQLRQFLKDRGIATAIHYPKSLPFLKAYRYLGHRPEDFPVAHTFPDEILSLPMFPELTEQEIDYVCDAIREYGRNRSASDVKRQEHLTA